MASAALKAAAGPSTSKLFCRCQDRICSVSLSTSVSGALSCVRFRGLSSLRRMRCMQHTRRRSRFQRTPFPHDALLTLQKLSWGTADQKSLASAATQVDGTDSPPGGRLILLDAFALLYRAYFGLKEAMLATKTGKDTSILFAFIRTLLDLLEVQPAPTHFAVVFDAAGLTFSNGLEVPQEIRPSEDFNDEYAYVTPLVTAKPARLDHKSFRHEMYAGYKGQRPPTPEPISEALKQLRDLLRVMAIPEIAVPGIEADDVIGTISNRALKQGFQVAIASPDKDFFQLLRPGLQLLRPPKKGYSGPLLGNLVPYTAQTFEDEWNLQPNQFADLLAFSGDSADNIPGVRGIGPKRAQALLRAHGDLEGVLANAHAEKVKATRTALTSEEGIQAARLSKKLVTIQTDVELPPLKFPFSYLLLQPPTDTTKAAVRAAFAALEFKRHEQRLDGVWQNIAQNQTGSFDADSSVWRAAARPAEQAVIEEVF